MELPDGLEPPVGDLQSPALPLGYGSAKQSITPEAK